MKKLKPLKSAFCSLLVMAASLGLTACSMDTYELRLEKAKRIATPSFMLHREITAEPFKYTVYERIYDRGGPATVYIEGDGVAWLSRTRPSRDPTPRNPMALHLASRDNSKNVIYIARPCQYSKMADGSVCDDKYWTSSRFAPEVIDSMNRVLSSIKMKYGITEFNLVGYSGGANIAALLTARRGDVITLRTVAGNLDHVRLNEMHDVSPMPESLNAADVAAQIKDIPQHHFIGEWDKVVTPMVFDSYRAVAGPTTCIRSSIVREVNHHEGWVNIWPELLKAPLDCEKII